MTPTEPNSITITPEERDILYNRILIRLTGIDDVYRAVARRDWPAAQRLGQEFSDLLRLVCTDLGWGDARPTPLTLTTPPDVLHRATANLRELAGADQRAAEAHADEARGVPEEVRRLEGICERILQDTPVGSC